MIAKLDFNVSSFASLTRVTFQQSCQLFTYNDHSRRLLIKALCFVVSQAAIVKMTLADLFVYVAYGHIFQHSLMDADHKSAITLATKVATKTSPAIIELISMANITCDDLGRS